MSASSGLHIGLVMDGNGRWAAAQNLPRSAGHEAGARALAALISHAAAREDVAQLSVFAFSTENWRRPQAEIRAIFALLDRFLARAKADFLREGVAFCAFGELSALRQKPALERLAQQTAAGSRLRLNIGLNYGAIDECARAAAALAARGEEINAHSLQAALDLPASVDLLIRTGNRARLSNFLLLQSAYAHIVFSPLFFPDFSPAALDAAIESFYAEPRTFGGL